MDHEEFDKGFKIGYEVGRHHEQCKLTLDEVTGDFLKGYLKGYEKGINDYISIMTNR